MTEGYKFQLNIKVGTGYDASLLNVNGADATEFDANLHWVVENAAKIVAAVAAVEALNVVKPLSNNVASTSVQNTAATPVTTPDPGPAPSCAHGPKKWVPGGFSTRTQRAYDGFWACQAPQGQAKCRN